jgi:hypothetical protein
MRDIRDLVERLRKHDESAQVLTAQQPPFSIFGEAADEIERLRALWIGADDSPPEALQPTDSVWISTPDGRSWIYEGGEWKCVG